MPACHLCSRSCPASDLDHVDAPGGGGVALCVRCVESLDDLPQEHDRELLDVLADANRDAWAAALDADPAAWYTPALTRVA